jgi:hypothetical protein
MSGTNETDGKTFLRSRNLRPESKGIWREITAMNFTIEELNPRRSSGIASLPSY